MPEKKGKAAPSASARTGRVSEQGAAPVGRDPRLAENERRAQLAKKDETGKEDEPNKGENSGQEGATVEERLQHPTGQQTPSGEIPAKDPERLDNPNLDEDAKKDKDLAEDLKEPTQVPPVLDEEEPPPAKAGSDRNWFDNPRHPTGREAPLDAGRFRPAVEDQQQPRGFAASSVKVGEEYGLEWGPKGTRVEGMVRDNNGLWRHPSEEEEKQRPKDSELRKETPEEDAEEVIAEVKTYVKTTRGAIRRAERNGLKDLTFIPYAERFDILGEKKTDPREL